MEPRSRERGSDDVGLEIDFREWLQWSRVHVNAEVSQMDPRALEGRAASMEPRSRERGSLSRPVCRGNLAHSFNGAAFT